jgi:RNA polymerase-binding transcription factor DksA
MVQPMKHGSPQGAQMASTTQLTKLRVRLIADCALQAAHASDLRIALDEGLDRTDTSRGRQRVVAEVEIDRSNEAIIDIFNALLRIDAGVYGTCSDCGGPVPFAALDANPRERYCPNCPAVRVAAPSRTHVARSR